MIRLNKLYSQPNTFETIEFRDGINLILGEKVKEDLVQTRRDRKTNGVGKSMCIEFINFCLLSDSSNSRVMKIPFDKFESETEIMLDLTIGDIDLTVSRTKEDPDKPKIILKHEVNQFENIHDARKFLLQILYNNGYTELSNIPISFREFLAPIIRDEDSEFKDIVYTYDLGKNIPHTQLIKPHLYYLGINLLVFEEIKTIYKELTEKKKDKNNLEKKLTKNHTKKLSEIKSEANNLNAEVDRIGDSLEKLKTNEAYLRIQDDMNSIEAELGNLRKEQKAIRYELKNINSLPSFEHIQTEEIKFLYNRYREGLGTQLVKSLDQVIKLKEKIDTFQKSILKSKVDRLILNLRAVTKKIKALEEDRKTKLNLVSSKGELSDYMNSHSIFRELLNKHGQIKTQLDNLEKLDREITSIELERDQNFMKLDADIFGLKDTLKSIMDTILQVHEYIMGNKEASFDIKTKKNKEKIIEFEYRIFADGSRSVDRTKVFIYDIALLFNEKTSLKHPHFLIHDNIFDVDQDTLIQSLNYLAQQETENTDFQYILTLNRDKIENEEKRKEIKLDIDEHKIANFTKRSPFLKIDYQEI